jgi:hypothetical protein
LQQQPVYPPSTFVNGKILHLHPLYIVLVLSLFLFCCFYFFFFHSCFYSLAPHISLGF